MEYVRISAQLIVALGILNVWLFRFNMATPYRAGSAKNMREEFAAYGLSPWFMWLIGGLKVLLALSLLASFWLPELLRPAATIMAILMLSAVLMHLKVRDPFTKAVPASTVLLLSIIVLIS